MRALVETAASRIFSTESVSISFQYDRSLMRIFCSVAGSAAAAAALTATGALLLQNSRTFRQARCTTDLPMDLLNTPAKLYVPEQERRWSQWSAALVAQLAKHEHRVW